MSVEHKDWLPTKTLQKAAVVDEKGNILVLRRSENEWDKRSGKWDLPGGSVEEEDLETAKKNGDDPTEIAIKREISEETGLDVEELTMTFVSKRWSFERSVGLVLGTGFGYRATVKGITPAVTFGEEQEHIEFKWAKKEEVLGLDFGNDGGFCLSILEKA